MSLETSDAATIEIDRCKACASAFFDFDDGEPGNIARALQESITEDTQVADEAELVCPDCQATMEWSRYLNDGPRVGRCGSCMALYIPTNSISWLAEAGVHLGPEPKGVWGRFVDALSKALPD